MTDDSPTITVSKQELFMMLGEVALPPFVGHPEADTWDCAPIVSDIIERVESRFANRWNEVSA